MNTKQAVLSRKLQRLTLLSAFAVIAMVSLLGQVARAANPEIEYIEVIQAARPNPAAPNEQWTAILKIHLEDPATRQEIEPPAGTTYKWVVASVAKDGKDINPFDVVCDPDNAQQITVKGKYAQAGRYVAGISVTVSNPAWKDDAGNPSPLYELKRIDVDVVATAFRVNVTGPWQTRDGDKSGEFKATVGTPGVTATSYQWSSLAPAGAGNNPQVDFATPSAQTTVVDNAHWFALPDNRLTASNRSTYTIKAEVGSTNNGSTYGKTSWDVWLPKIGGQVKAPKIVGLPTVAARQVNGVEEWFVTGKGDLQRQEFPAEIFVPQSSQFYAKVKAHEDRHVLQFTTGVGNPNITVHTLWDLNQFYNLIKDLTAPTKTELLGNIGVAMSDFNKVSDEEYDRQESAIEDDAYNVSNQIAPRYLYER